MFKSTTIGRKLVKYFIRFKYNLENFIRSYTYINILLTNLHDFDANNTLYHARSRPKQVEKLVYKNLNRDLLVKQLKFGLMMKRDENRNKDRATSLRPTQVLNCLQLDK